MKMGSAYLWRNKEEQMTYCTECRYKGTPDCPVKALGDRMGAEIIAEGCTDGVSRDE